MSYDINGRRPDARAGERFEHRGNWETIVNCVRRLVPAETHAYENWHFNNGDGLDAELSIALADRLERCLAEGVVESYVAERDAYLAQHPRRECHVCDGTGIRCDEAGRKAGYPDRIVADEPKGNPRAGKVGWCDRCDGWGTLKEYGSYRDLYVSDVREFIEFLRHSGGFAIW
ncbi:hypothetical protein [Mesorhizobium sp. LjNodule214]|uniref:hypothetical protein n=1 Tax=Mesorhizobium sp. LjNodule214 TaxID=3342252 RepID=UPI003ECCBA89